MPRRPRPAFRALHAVSPLVAWAMALLIVAQGSTVAALRAVGPAHQHAAAGAALVLDDVRRAPHVVIAVAAVAHGHSHESSRSAVARHHHPRSDATVVFVDGELRIADGAGDDGSTGSETSAFLALPLAGLAFSLEAPRSPAAPVAAWSVQTHDPEHPERPPRPA